MSFIETNGSKVWFEKLGSGPDVVLLIPGAVGTGWTDFGDLLDSEDEIDFDKFTVVTVDPPGQGRSRPPMKQYGVNVYNNDCDAYHQIMQGLGFDKYSVIGYCEGAKVALLMATKYRQSVESLVLTAISTQQSIKVINHLLSNKSVDKWHKNTIANYLKVYDSKEEIQKLWNRYVNFIQFYSSYFPGDIFKDKYHLVTCPVLLVHGDKDPIVSTKEVLDLEQRLPNVLVHRFPNGEHDCHQKYATVFTKIVQEHIINRRNIHNFKQPKTVTSKLLKELV